MNLDQLNKILDTPHIQDILIQIETILDNIDLYVFDHWFDGTIVVGPKFYRHWVKIILAYDEKPDPRGISRLKSRGITVRTKNYKKENYKQEEITDTFYVKFKQEIDDCYLYELSFPRHVLESTGLDLSYYDETINISDYIKGKETKVDDMKKDAN